MEENWGEGDRTIFSEELGSEFQRDLLRQTLIDLGRDTLRADKVPMWEARAARLRSIILSTTPAAAIGAPAPVPREGRQESITHQGFVFSHILPPFLDSLRPYATSFKEPAAGRVEKRLAEEWRVFLAGRGVIFLHLGHRVHSLSYEGQASLVKEFEELFREKGRPSALICPNLPDFRGAFLSFCQDEDVEVLYD